MIVKVQISDIPSGNASVFIYDETRKYQCIDENPSKEVLRFFGYKRGQMKQFWHAKVENGNFVPLKKACWQDW